MAEKIARARLCRLFKSAFGSYDELSVLIPTVLSAEMERDFLISLTMVNRALKRWTLVGGDCEEDLTLDTIKRDECSWHNQLPVQCHSCVVNAISLLLAFLGCTSQHVQHIACKSLVAVSGFLQKYENSWDEFSHVLWTGLGLMIIRNSPDKYTTSNSAHLLATGDDLAALMKSIPNRYDFRAPALLMETLKIIHKSLNFEDCDFSEVNLSYGISSLLNFRWDFLFSKFEAQARVDDEKRSSPPPSGLFLGATLQLLCSLVEKTDFEVESCQLDDSSAYIKVTSLVSDLLVYCFSNPCRFDTCLSQYLRHKSLALMIRLSDWAHWRNCALETWVQLIKNHFKYFLLKPITNVSVFSVASMEGSPFQPSIPCPETSGNVYTTHLHRQTIFLFIKCCYSSFHCLDEVNQQQELGFDGLVELSTWLQVHVPVTNDLKSNHYLTSCVRFSTSFLELFVDEDGLLFDMLLLMLDTPSPASKECQGTEQRTRDVTHLWNVFNPILLFHLFLQLVHYDHSLLLDYLISKDSGILCLQYLLRCLRLACENWGAVSEFSVVSTPQNHQAARRCLLSLKTSLEGLHERGLFPYNPTPLLKRFTRFHQLCDETSA